MVAGITGIRNEMNVLRKHYNINIPPVLLIEILADLKKENEPEKSILEVKKLASKLIYYSTYPNVHYLHLLLNELLENTVTMDGRPIVGGNTRELIDESGKRGYITDLSKESKTLRFWNSGQFSEAEELLANDWRHSSKGINLDEFKNDVKDKAPLVAGADDVETVKKYIAEFLNTLDYQPLIQSWLLADIQCDDKLKSRINERLQSLQGTRIQMYAPYSYYYFLVTFTFYSALVHGIVGARATNIIDMEYVFYLPFTNIFASGDKFHDEFVPVFLKTDQEYVNSSLLKTDLHALSQFWGSLNETESAAWDRYYGSRPPLREHSFTTAMWTKFMLPWFRGSGNQAIDMSEEEAKAIIEEMKDKIEEYENDE